jgi:Tol biopolymer transport system component
MRHLSATMSAKTTLWMCVALAAGIVAAWLMVVLATPVKPAEAAFPGKNGKIAFTSRLDCCDSEIFTMKANGDNKTVLTNNGVDDDYPAFSPNGRKIAFTRARANTDIFTMSANGTDKKRVTRSERSESDPAWSPNGTKIAFVRAGNGNKDIYVMNKDGTGLTRLTTSPRSDTDPAWSPDGTRIAFRRGIAGPKIYVMKAARESETNIPQRLTTTSGRAISEWYPAWSPDGSRIAFTSTQAAPCECGDFDIYSIGADGSDQIRLTTTSRGLQAAWSPDGTKIAFSGEREGDSDWRIYVMNAAPESETNPPKPLTGHTISLSPDWQPLR